MYAKPRWTHVRKPATTLAFALALLLTSVTAEAYTVVMKTGKRLEVDAKPRWGFGRAPVKLDDGRRLTLMHAGVNHAATEKANPSDAGTSGDSKTWTMQDLQRLSPDTQLNQLESTHSDSRNVRRVSSTPSRTSRSNQHSNGQCRDSSADRRSAAEKAYVDSLSRNAERRRDRALARLANNGESPNSVQRSQRSRDRSPRSGGTSLREAARGSQKNLAKSRRALQKQRTNQRYQGRR